MDNSGARYVECIKALGGFNRKYAFAGDYILVSIKKLRLVRKVKVGQVLMGLVTRTRKETRFLDSSSVKCQNNIVLVMTRKNRILGTRFFG
jgi:large subunit ribosomal protein L14